jgi:hypothetical protein
MPDAPGCIAPSPQLLAGGSALCHAATRCNCMRRAAVTSACVDRDSSARPPRRRHEPRAASHEPRAEAARPRAEAMSREPRARRAPRLALAFTSALTTASPGPPAGLHLQAIQRQPSGRGARVEVAASGRRIMRRGRPDDAEPPRHRRRPAPWPLRASAPDLAPRDPTPPARAPPASTPRPAPAPRTSAPNLAPSDPTPPARAPPASTPRPAPARPAPRLQPATPAVRRQRAHHRHHAAPRARAPRTSAPAGDPGPAPGLLRPSPQG